MHKVLVPFDGSDSAGRALAYVIGLAKEVGSIEVLLAMAHEPPMVHGEIAIYVSTEKLEAFQRQHSDEILAPARERLAESGVPFIEQVLVGPVAESIAACATQQGCDAIVRGTRGMSAMGNLLMGSIATKVVHVATVPVTLVK